MNAHVDPARYFDDGNDAKLIALCKATIHVLEEEVALKLSRFDAEEAYYAKRPSYPGRLSPQTHGCIYSAAQLRVLLEEHGQGAESAWRDEMNALIDDVEAWEKECSTLPELIGLQEAEQLCVMASQASKAYVDLLPGMAARTSEGAALKAMVLAHWIEAGRGVEDLGDDLVRSVVEDIRRTGAARNRSYPEVPDDRRAIR